MVYFIRKCVDKSRFAISESMNNIIRVYHDEMAHCGHEKTTQEIVSNYWFPTSRKRIHEYIDNCLIWLVSNSAVNSREGQLQETDHPSLSFEIVHIDHFGPLKEASDGSKHILLLDVFTRFTWLFLVKTTSSKKVIKLFTSLFNTFGNLQTLISDRGLHIARIEPIVQPHIARICRLLEAQKNQAPTSSYRRPVG